MLNFLFDCQLTVEHLFREGAENFGDVKIKVNLAVVCTTR